MRRGGQLAAQGLVAVVVALALSGCTSTPTRLSIVVSDAGLRVTPTAISQPDFTGYRVPGVKFRLLNESSNSVDLVLVKWDAESDLPTTPEGALDRTKVNVVDEVTGLAPGRYTASFQSVVSGPYRVVALPSAAASQARPATNPKLQATIMVRQRSRTGGTTDSTVPQR